jgi:alanine racemase
VTITVDLSSAVHNLAQIARITPNSAILAMVKANAYGHGSIRITQALTKAAAFGVASLAEAIVLREQGIIQPIVLMQGVYNLVELQLAVAQQLTLVVHDCEQIKLLQSYQTESCVSVWLKINTGMHRLGFNQSLVAKAYEQLQACPLVKQPLGLMTHLSQADNLAVAVTSEQLKLFATLTKNLPGNKSIANSAGILYWPDSHADWVRPGLILYGVSPACHNTAYTYNLRPVMTLSAQLLVIKLVKKNEYIGYGGTWQAPHDMLLGIVAIGYADGYPQMIPSGTPVIVDGRYCPIVGRVSMDMLAIDLTNHPNVSREAAVILWGPNLPVELIARAAKTSPYELLCRVSTMKRARVMYLGGQ